MAIEAQQVVERIEGSLLLIRRRLAQEEEDDS